MKDKTVVVFDLDDTLCSELEFLHSAFKEIADSINHSDSGLFSRMISWYENKEDVFSNLCSEYDGTSKEELLNAYRSHQPVFESTKAQQFLLNLKEQGYLLGLITDGRSVTQRNKLKALGIESLFDKIIISEEFGSDKSKVENFKVFHEFNAHRYYYIGDNPLKDFYHPNKLGWITVCLKDNGKNIHSQKISEVSDYNPNYYIYSLEDLTTLL